jgi:hypothetical protein
MTTCHCPLCCCKMIGTIFQWQNRRTIIFQWQNGSTNCFKWQSSTMTILDDNMPSSIMLLQNGSTIFQWQNGSTTCFKWQSFTMRIMMDDNRTGGWKLLLNKSRCQRQNLKTCCCQFCCYKNGNTSFAIEEEGKKTMTQILILKIKEIKVAGESKSFLKEVEVDEGKVVAILIIQVI